MNYFSTDNFQQPQSLDMRVSAVMKESVYVKMFLGLIVTALVAWLVAATASSDHSFLAYLATNRWLYWGLALVELGLVLAISAGLRKMSAGMATGLFFLFAVVNGLTLSLIFVAYSLPSIFKTFLICAGVFGAMSIYGYFTTRDLTRIAYRCLLHGPVRTDYPRDSQHLLGRFGTLDWIVSFLGVAIFIGITAWDTQTIKRMAMADPTMADGRSATLGALNLYLDFINLFLYLLRFFGSSRD